MLSPRKILSRFKPDWYVCINTHWRRHGVFPNFILPRTYNEKILHRMLFDRRRILTQMADKAGVRSYVEARLGPSVLPRLYHLTDRPETIPFDELPEKFAVKPTHASGWLTIVTDKSSLDRSSLIETCHGWLKASFYKQTREWVYKNIRPQILVEEFIDDGSAKAATDYKFYVFGGKVKLLHVTNGRYIHLRARFYTPDWQPMEENFAAANPMIGDLPAPPHLAEMIAAAETLGRGMDFVRVDLYDTPAQFYVGELTNTPGRSLSRFRPREFDRHLGDLWRLAPFGIALPGTHTD